MLRYRTYTRPKRPLRRQAHSNAKPNSKGARSLPLVLRPALQPPPLLLEGAEAVGAVSPPLTPSLGAALSPRLSSDCAVSASAASALTVSALTVSMASVPMSVSTGT